MTTRVRTLIVDDTEDLRLLLRLVLESSGRYEVVGEAGDGHEALVLATETTPDLVLLDLSMPRMDGLELLPRLRQSLPRAHLVVLSAFGARMAASEARHAGAHAYLEKGLAPDELLSALDATMGAELPSEVAHPRPELRPEVASPPVHEVVGRLAHDLRNPVTVALGAMETLRRRVPLEDPAVADLVARAEQGLERLARSLEAAVDYATLGAAALDLRALDPREVLQECQAQVAHEPGRLHLEVLTPCRVVADRSALVRALTILADNALRYSTGPVELVVRDDGGQVLLEVADRGPGVGTETAQLFRPFVRGASACGSGGHGLGLATAADLARRMGGEVSARDRDRGGAVFTLRLPAA